MSNKMKLCGRILFFIAGFIWIFTIIQDIFIPKWKFIPNYAEGDTDKYHSFYQLPQNSLDYIVLGTSHSFYSINPLEIYSKTGEKGYNLGSPVQAVSTSYYWLVEACKYQNPSYVIFDVSSLTNNPKDTSLADISKAFINMKMSRNKIAAIFNSKKEFANISSICELIVPLYQFHTRWDDLGKADWESTSDDYFFKGSYLKFQALSVTEKPFINLEQKRYYNLNNGSIKYHQNFALISEENKNYFDKMVSFCDSNGIRLIPFKFPSKNWMDNEKTSVQEFLSTYNLDLIDLNEEGVLNLNWDTDTGDNGYHTNYWGATKTSIFLASWLANQTDLIADDPENNDKSWMDDLRKYGDWEQFNLNSGKEKALFYLETLAKHKNDLYVIMSVRDESSSGWNEDIQAVINKLGLNSNFYGNPQNSFITIIDGGRVVFEKWDNAPMQLDANFSAQSGQQISISSGGFTFGDVSRIIINDIDYSLNSRGLNIVVIDKKTENVISSVCIDTHVADLTFSEKSLPDEQALIWSDYCKASQLLEDGIYTIAPVGNSECALNIADNKKNVGANVNLAKYTGEDSQQFEVTHVGNGFYTLRALCSDHYISVDSGGNQGGTNVIQDVATNLAPERWFILQNSDGTFSLISLYNKLAIDVPDGIAMPDADVRLWDRNDADAQRFLFTRVD